MIKKFYGVVRLIFFPLTDFFLGRFWAFLDEGNSKTRLKKSRHRTCTKVQSWPNKVRTYIGFLFFFLSPLGLERRTQPPVPSASTPRPRTPHPRGTRKREKNAHGGGWVLFLGISGPEKHLFVFRFSQDAPLK